jgi:hypothetical protein
VTDVAGGKALDSSHPVSAHRREHREPGTGAGSPFAVRKADLVQSEHLQWPWAILKQAVVDIMVCFVSYQTFVQESCVLELQYLRVFL